MKIIILGAGQVGSSLVESLADSKTDITLVDINAKKLSLLQNKLDIRTVKGWVSHPEVLRLAGCADADLLIAVTNNDEANLLACQLADKLFNTPTKIARVRSPAYLTRRGLFEAENFFGLDLIFSPEELVAKHFIPLIEYSGAMQVIDLADGLVQLVEVNAHFGGLLVGEEIGKIPQLVAQLPFSLAAIYRQDKPLDLTPSTKIQVDDEVYFLTQRKYLKSVINLFRSSTEATHRLILAGGGNIGLHLAASLEHYHPIKLIESNPARCIELAEKLQRSLVINGSATDKSLLQEEGISHTDIFCALTNSDEVNLLSSLLAKHLGAAKVITLVSNPAYLRLVANSAIDLVVSPQEITLSSLLTYLRQGQVKSVHSLRQKQAEVIEMQALGDATTSQVIGKPLNQLRLPQGVVLLGLVRQETFYLPKEALEIASQDRLIFFLTSTQQLPKLEKLFSVSLGFFN